MRKSRLFKNMFLALFAVSAMTSCGSDDGGGSNYDNLKDTANANGLTSFVAAAELAGVDNLLTESSDYTIFVPTNTAFSEFLLSNGYASIEAVPQALLREIVLNHFLSGDLPTTALSTGYKRTLAKGSASTTSAINMFINTASGIKLNGIATVTTGDVRASNGRIFIIDKALGLPTITTHLQANPDLSALLAAFSTYPDSQFIQTLSSESGQAPFTLVAPNNNAMTSLLNELDVDNFSNIPEADADEILSYHILGGQNKFYTQLSDGSYLTLSGQNFTIQNTGGGKKITDTQSRTSNFTLSRDIQASNGIIHIIDKGLLPNL